VVESISSHAPQQVSLVAIDIEIKTTERAPRWCIVHQALLKTRTYLHLLAGGAACQKKSDTLVMVYDVYLVWAPFKSLYRWHISDGWHLSMFSFHCWQLLQYRAVAT